MKKRIILVILSLFVLAACSPTQTAVPQAGDTQVQATAMEEAAPAMAEVSAEDEMAGEGHDNGEMAAAGEDQPMDQDDSEMMGEEDVDGEEHMDDAPESEMAAGADDNEDGMEAATDEMDGSAAMRPAWQELALVNASTGEAFTLGGFEGKTVFVEPMATWCTNCRQQLNNVAQARGQLGDDVVFVALSLETTLDPAQLAAYQRDNGFDWTFAVMSEELLGQLADQFGRSITSAPSTPHFIIRPDGTFTELSTGIDDPQELIAMIQDAQS